MGWEGTSIQQNSAEPHMYTLSTNVSERQHISTNSGRDHSALRSEFMLVTFTNNTNTEDEVLCVLLTSELLTDAHRLLFPCLHSLCRLNKNITKLV